MQDFAKELKTGYLYPNHTCTYRLVANSIVKEVIEDQVFMYRFIKIKVSTSGGKVKVRGFLVEDPSKVIDNYEMFETLNKGFTEFDFLNTT